jgi:hypothetical protein
MWVGASMCCYVKDYKYETGRGLVYHPLRTRATAKGGDSIKY